jgi:hypothetical protein
MNDRNDRTEEFKQLLSELSPMNQIIIWVVINVVWLWRMVFPRTQCRK